MEIALPQHCNRLPLMRLIIRTHPEIELASSYIIEYIIDSLLSESQLEDVVGRVWTCCGSLFGNGSRLTIGLVLEHDVIR